MTECGGKEEHVMGSGSIVRIMTNGFDDDIEKRDGGQNED